MNVGKVGICALSNLLGTLTLGLVSYICIMRLEYGIVGAALAMIAGEIASFFLLHIYSFKNEDVRVVMQWPDRRIF